MSSVEVATTIFMMVYLCGNYMEFTPEDMEKTNKVFSTAYHVVTFLFYNSMILISVDRLIATLFPTRYYVSVQRSTLKKAVFGIWMFSFGAPTIFAGENDVNKF